MEQKLIKKILITPSMCDFTGCIGVADIFALFMDLAAEHAEHLGLGYAEMRKRDLFWITVKTKIKIYKKYISMRLMNEIIAETWPEVPQKHLCSRYYRLSREKNGETQVLAEGRTEWAVMDTVKKSLADISDLYPREAVPDEAPVCPEPFRRISRDFSDCRPLGEYTVRPTDIDMGGHMNNVAYVRALMGFLYGRDLAEIKEMEVNFTAQSFLDDKLSVVYRLIDGNPVEYEYAMLRKDGMPALLVYVKREPD